MKKIAILLGCALAVAACTSPEDQLENQLRENLASQGTVKEVELNPQADGNMTGFAIVTVNGVDSRLSCTAERDEAKGAGRYNMRCMPVIDEAIINQMEATIRSNLAARATVEQVELTRQDDNRMSGFVVATDNDGNQVRLSCEVNREAEGASNFRWQCNPEGEGGAPAAEE